MYLKHFALTHFPFDHTLQSEEIFNTCAQAEATLRLKHLFELRGIGYSPVSPAAVKPPCVAGSPRPCIRDFIA